MIRLEGRILINEIVNNCRYDQSRTNSHQHRPQQPALLIIDYKMFGIVSIVNYVYTIADPVL